MKKKYFINALLSLLLVLDFLSNCISYLATFFNVIATLSIIISFFCIYFKKKIPLKYFIIIILDFLIIIINKNVSNISLTIFLLCMIIVKDFYKDINIKLLFLVASICLLSIIIAYYFFDFNKQYDTSIWRPLQGIVVSRKSFGFMHPNQFMMRFFVVYILGLMIAYRKELFSIVFLFLGYFFNSQTQSRTVIYIIFGVTIVIFLMKFLKFNYYKNLSNRMRFLMAYSFLLFLFLSIILSCFFAGEKIDVMFSGRLAINKRFLLNGISFFGTKQYDNEPFDNSYIQMLITSGFLFVIIYVYIWHMFLCKSSEIKVINAIILFSILALAFMEVCMLKYSIMIVLSLVLNGNYLVKAKD